MDGNHSQKKQTGFYAVPYLAAEDERLSPLDEKVLGYILALSQETGYCYASSNYLAEIVRKSRTVITRSIKKLEATGYIVKQVTRPGYGQAERKIYPLVDRMGKRIPDPFNISKASTKEDEQDGAQIGTNGLTVGAKMNLMVGAKMNLSVGAKVNHNIYKNYIDNNNKEKKKLTHERLNNFPPPFDSLTTNQEAKLISYQQTMDAELINYEIKRVAKRQQTPKNPFAYLVAILNDLQAKGITTLEQARDDHQEQYKQQDPESKKDYNTVYPYRQRRKAPKIEQLPSWVTQDHKPKVGVVTPEDADRLGKLISDVTSKSDHTSDNSQ